MVMKAAIALLTLAAVLAESASLEAPQLCLNSTAGGLQCRCTVSLTELALQQWTVDCSSRDISALPQAWNISQVAQDLDLSRNKLSSLRSEQFSPWGNLEKLSLARNEFTALNEDAFVGLSNLRLLDLSHNSLATLPPKIFNGLSVLSVINLENNRLQELSPQLFSVTPHLNALKLSYNPALGKFLIQSPGFLTVALQKNLTSLEMNSMNIDTIPNDLFNEAAHLHHLSLADNPLKIIDFLPPTLESLNLSGINMTMLTAGSFIAYPNLKRLQLDRLTNLTEVEVNAFEGLTSLEVLTMENCVQLHKFDELAFGEPDSKAVPLRHLSLARSGLHTLSPKTFLLLEATLEHLNLQGNPWRCDCKLAWLRQLNFSLEDTGYLRCFYPDEHHNRLLLSMDPKDFVCTSPHTDAINTKLIILDVFIVLLALGVASSILVIMWRRRCMPCVRRQTVGKYSHVTIEPNRAELEWDDKDLDHIWSTPNANRPTAPRGS